MTKGRGPFISISAVSLLFAVGCGGGGDKDTGGSVAATPEAAFKDFQAAVKAADADKAWRLLSRESQDRMEARAKEMREAIAKKLKEFEADEPAMRHRRESMLASAYGISREDLKANVFDGKRVFGKDFKKAGEGAPMGEPSPLDQLAAATLENLKAEGDTATATVTTAAKSGPIRFAKEGGSWKLTMPE